MSSKVEHISNFFTPIIDSHALMSRNGEYFEAPLFHRNHELFVQVGKTFIKLSPNGNLTSKSGTYWRDLELSKGDYTTEQGRLVWLPVKKRKAA
jgi:hypothetical protein